MHEKGTPAKKVTLREAKENVDKVCDEVQRTVPNVNEGAQLLRLVGSCWMKFETGQASSYKLLFFGHLSFTRNKIQTAVTNMTKQRMFKNFEQLMT